MIWIAMDMDIWIWIDSARERVKVIDHAPTRLPKRAQALSKNAQRESEGEGANE